MRQKCIDRVCLVRWMDNGNQYQHRQVKRPQPREARNPERSQSFLAAQRLVTQIDLRENITREDKEQVYQRPAIVLNPTGYLLERRSRKLPGRVEKKNMVCQNTGSSNAAQTVQPE